MIIPPAGERRRTLSAEGNLRVYTNSFPEVMFFRPILFSFVRFVDRAERDSGVVDKVDPPRLTSPVSPPWKSSKAQPGESGKRLRRLGIFPFGAVSGTL